MFNTPVTTDTPGPLKEVCGTSGSYILLTVLTDITSQDTLFNGAIGFRIVNVDFSHERIVVYALPPEMVFSDSSIQAYGLLYPSLASAFNSIYNIERSNADALSLASNGTARLINENLGILASHYLIVDAANIEKYANTMGSVDVKLSGPFLSDEYDMARGSQKLDGTMIRKFITYKAGGGAGEWDRVLRQNDVINAFRAIAKKQDPASFVNTFTHQTEDGFASDLNTTQLTQLACLANSIESVRFRYFTVPISRLNINDDGTITIKDRDSLKANMANSLGGTGE
jgi:anionic cell wall polymer biosynthesis LytR-Cps2A-Psr (LCP) family protein